MTFEEFKEIFNYDGEHISFHSLHGKKIEENNNFLDFSICFDVFGLEAQARLAYSIRNQEIESRIYYDEPSDNIKNFNFNNFDRDMLNMIKLHVYNVNFKNDKFTVNICDYDSDKTNIKIDMNKLKNLLDIVNNNGYNKNNILKIFNSKTFKIKIEQKFDEENNNYRYGQENIGGKYYCTISNVKQLVLGLIKEEIKNNNIATINIISSFNFNSIEEVENSCYLYSIPLTFELYIDEDGPS